MLRGKQPNNALPPALLYFQTSQAELFLLDEGIYRFGLSLALLERRCSALGVSVESLCLSVWARLLSQYSGELEVSFGAFTCDSPIPEQPRETCLCKLWRRGTYTVDVAFAPGRTDDDIRRDIESGLRDKKNDTYETVVSVYSSRHESPHVARAAEDSDFILHLEVVLNTGTDQVQLTAHYDSAFISGDAALFAARCFLGSLSFESSASSHHPTRFANLQPEFLSICQPSGSAPVDTSDKNLWIHHLFEGHAAATPDSVCLEFLSDHTGEVESWTFKELNETANRIAHLILKAGIARDEAVPVCLEKSLFYYAAILAAMKAGVPFTPIDPLVPIARKKFMIEELEARFVLSTPNHFAELGLDSNVNLLDLSNEESLRRLSPQNPQVADLTERCLAYRLYTSGSTGQPKAVSLEVGSIVHAIQKSINILPLHHDTRLLQFAAITFDMCYFDCFLAWTVGFTLISASRRYLLGELETTINRLQINFLDLTPSLAATLNAHELPNVEMLYCIGEAMPTKIVEDWEGRCVNSYGPTEAAMLCTITDVKKDIKSANFGQPFDGMSLYILDKDRPVILPRMAVGELCICGPQLAREYHRNEAKTASSFITLESGLRLYRTGDLARMLADGTFEFVGRKDDQVKLRGFRIELGEVSAVLEGVHPLVKDAVALVLRHSEGDKEQLVAFLSFSSRKNRLDPPSIQDSEDSEWAEIERAAKRAAEAALPDYMLPHIYLPINWIPLSAAAKVDKRSLTDLFRQINIFTLGRKAESDAADEDLDEVSCKIRDAFAEASHSEPATIALDTTIYQLGLDSISALAVARELKAIGVNAGVLDIVEHPTIRSLRDHVLKKKNPVSSAHHQDPFASFKQRHMNAICQSAGISRDSVSNAFPCSPMQEGILAQFLQSKGSLYYNAIAFVLEQDIDLSRLDDAWKQVVAQHDIFRTGFVEYEVDGGHYAMITYKPPLSSPVQRVESKLPIEQVMQEIQAEGAAKALQNTALPPWFVVLVSNGSVRHMVFTALHTIYDAQTLHILLSDVKQIYQGQQPAPHASFSPILKEMLRMSRHKGTVESSAEYWKSVLLDCPVTKFPVMTPLRVSVGEDFASYRKCSVTMKSVEDLCKQAGVSLGAAGQAAWAKLLAMYSGERDICFGTVISGRTGVDNAEDVVFPCITTIPIRVRLEGENKAVMSQIQNRLIQTLKFQHTPLRAIQKALGHPEQTLFDTIFVYQKLSSTGDKSKAIWRELDAKATVEYPVSFEIEPTDDGYLGIRLTGRTDILPKGQMDIMVSQYEYCLLHMLENLDADAMDLGSVPKELISDTPAEFDLLPCDVEFLHEFVSASTRRHPDKVALEFATSIHGDKAVKDAWTYRQFNNIGNRIANFLLQNGANAGDLVGICFDKTPQAYFGILGILKAGCAFVALDFSAPVQRRAFIVKDAKINIILTMAAFSNDFAGISGLQVHSLDNLSTLTRYFSTEEPEVTGLTPQDLCYVLYTSGTTGTPKGCRITHENAVQAMLSFQTLFKGHWDENSRFLQFASLHFDVSVLEQYWSWSVGVCMTSAPRDLIFQDIGNAIRALEITHIDLTPSLARLITPEETPSLCRGVFITGGEKLKQDVLDVWGERDVIYNGYGPTEATIGVTMYPRVPRNGRPSNIGPQFVNVGSMVLKPQTMIPVLRGAVGELCVTGALVGDGYLNREDLTNERFPYIDGKRMYRTGDLVRQLHNGCFDYLGRADDQVKLRGQRLELGEINETIRNSEGSVAEVVTLVCQHGQQQVQQLASFVSFKYTSEGRGSPSPAELLKEFPAPGLGSKILQACQSRLPIYMVPTYILPITKLPLTVNNKVDERTLRALFSNTSMEIIQSFEEASPEESEFSETETAVRDTLQEMSIDTATATKHTSFFQLGLDSVSIVSFSNKLRKKGFQNIEVSLVMQNPTIASLAQSLSTSTPIANDGLHDAVQKIKAFSVRHSFEVCSKTGLGETDIERIMPCTPLQEGMIARALHADVPLYYNTFRFKVRQDTTPEKLRGAWQAVVDRTDILRTCFYETPDGIAQVVLKKSEIDWKNASAECRDRKIATDSATPPIAFECFVRNNEQYLRVSIFHALYDGTSMPMILADVESILSTGKAPERMQFADAVPRILSLDVDGAKKFWADHFRGAQTALTEPRELGTKASEITRSCALEFPKESFEQAARNIGCTIQALFQASCIQALVCILQRQVTVGVITSGRSFTVDGIEACIGPLFNSIPCHLPISKGLKWKDYALQAHQFNTSSIPYHHTPLRQISKWIGQGSKPIFDILFVFQPGTPDLTDSVLEEIDSSAVSDYPVALEVQQDINGRYSISVTANSAHLSDSEISILLARVATGIADLLGDPEQELSVLRGVEADLFSNDGDGITPESSTPDRTGSTWTDTALAIREELSVLTGVPEHAIAEKSSIYQIGLDSVEAIRLSSRLQKRGVLLKVSDIMRETTIERMVAYLSTLKTEDRNLESQYTLADFERGARSALKAKSPLLRLEGLESILPTTPLQDVMIAESIGSDFALYFNHDVFELPKGTNVQRFQQAWKTVVRQNAILRTTFEEAHGITTSDYVQVVWKDLPLEWDIVDATSDHEFGRVDELIASHKARKAPLALGLVCSDQRDLMILSISHALYDGRSIQLLLEDVAQEYSGESTRRPDYKPFLHKILNLDMKTSIRFWKQLLSHAKPLTFPAVEEEAKVWKAEATSKVSTHDFVQFCREQRVSEPVLGQACWSFLLSDILGQDDVVFGTVVSGRETEESEEYMFPTMNTIPVRAVLHGSIGEVLEAMQHGYSQSLGHQFVALRDIQRNVCEAGQRIFDTLFVYQKSRVAQDGHKLWKSVGGASQIEYAVAVEIEISGDTLVWRISASSHAMGSDEIEGVLDTLDAILQRIILDPTADHRMVSGSTLGANLHKRLQRAREQNTELEHSEDGQLEETDDFRSLQRQVVKAISSISKVETTDIKSSTSIFHLGIDSISAIRIASELRKCSIFISVSEILRESTVDKISKFLHRKQRGPKPSPEPAPLQPELSPIQIACIISSANIQQDNVEYVTPATAGQTFLVKAWEASQGRILLPTFPFKAAEVLNPTRLENALKKLIAANTILRTTFASEGDGLFQIIHKHASPDFTSTVFETDVIPTSYLPQINQSEQARAYDMSKPSIRVHLASSRQESYIFLTLHHALYDAFTMPVLLSQLSALYKTADAVLPSPVRLMVPPPRPETKEFWTAYFAKQQYTLLPQKHYTAAMTERVELYREKHVPNAFKIEAKCRAHGISLHALAIAAFGRTLSRLLSVDSPILGIYLSNRHLVDHTDRGTSDPMAPTLNLVPLVVENAAKFDLIAVARQVQTDLLKISTSDAARTSLLEIYQWTGVRVDSFVNFLKEDKLDGGSRSSGLFERVELAAGSATVARVFSIPDTLRSRGNVVQTNLDFEVALRDGCLDVGVFAARRVLDNEDIRRISDDIKAILTGV
ncbi:hypothetical protein DRE_04582 [Drechslerella stenobrocha 248]|uniref:Carrier domain-containing protein n=1 Tax=Drechslerella stenobrocha 248 TaxID=1043628 RepID=W7HSI7_9PEZI|nr:hypothetical protein DRE_04582 [Drechslerella stenobrocha 248]